MSKKIFYLLMFVGCLDVILLLGIIIMLAKTL